MSLDEECLEKVANGGLMDFEKWAGMVEPLLERLEYIVHNAFPIPKILPEALSSVAHEQPSSYPSVSYLQEPNSSNNKEIASPADLQTPSQPIVPSFMTTPSSSERVPDSQPQSFAGPSNETIPAPLLSLLDSIRSTIRSFFASRPPHTVQRLAELIIRPNAHYKTLPAYLRAVDRVVSVTSSADVFPFQMEASASQLNGTMNGAGSSFMFPDQAPGSDESLGGALLTPIPWLSSVVSPEGNGAEALMSEGLVPSEPVPLASQQSQLQQEVEGLSTQPTITAHSVTAVVENEEISGTGSPPADGAEEIPHARGPPIVGVQDLGLQDGKGVEMLLSSNEAVPDNQTAGQDDQQPSTTPQGQDGNTESASKGNADGDGDIQLGDAKNAAEGMSAGSEADKAQTGPSDTAREGV